MSTYEEKTRRADISEVTSLELNETENPAIQEDEINWKGNGFFQKFNLVEVDENIDC